MKAFVTVAEMVKMLDVSLELSPVDPEGDYEKIQDWASTLELDTGPACVPYARYDTNLARLVAALYGEAALMPSDFSARLCGSGMQAITCVLLSSIRRGGVVAGNVLYGEAADLLQYLWNDFGVPVEMVDSSSVDEIMEAYYRTANDHGRATLFFETLGNGVPMPVLPLPELLEELWNFPGRLVVDNTLLTPTLFSPFEVYMELYRRCGPPNLELVYVESLSKYYRASARSGNTTLGVVVGPQEYMNGPFDRMLKKGFAVSLPALAGFPAHLDTAREHVMQRLCHNAQVALHFLQGRRPLVEQVWYPHNHPLLPKGAGGVLYCTLKDKGPREIKEMFAQAAPFRSSFGHPHLTSVAYGDYGMAPNLLRLAMGTNDTPEQTAGKLRLAMGD